MKAIPGPSGGGDLEAFHARCVLSWESMPMSPIGTRRKRTFRESRQNQIYEYAPQSRAKPPSSHRTA